MKKLIFIAVIAMFTAAAVFAQMPLTDWESPQSESTQGLFRSDADNFIRPDHWNSVEFAKFFALVSFASTEEAMLGYAANAGSLYIAAAYNGTFAQNFTNRTYTDENGEGYGWGGGKKNFSIYQDLDFSPGSPLNRASILIGVKDMGFRLTFTSSYESFSESDIYFGQFYKNYETKFGFNTPEIAWSMTRDLTENGIRPWVTLAVRFYKDSTVYEAYLNDGAGTTTGSFTENSRNYTSPVIGLGLGGYTFYRSEGSFSASADLEYSLEMRMFNNDYSYIEGDKYKTSSIKGINAGGDLYEISNSQHIITPSVTLKWSGEALSLRGQLRLPVWLTSLKVTDKIEDDGSLVSDGDSFSSFAIRFQPQIRLAAQWQIIPKLALNMGGSITFANMNRAKIKGDIYDDNSKVDDSSYERIVKTFGDTTNILTIGATFLPIENLTFEANCGVITNEVRVFDAEGLLRFFSILASLKF